MRYRLLPTRGRRLHGLLHVEIPVEELWAAAFRYATDIDEPVLVLEAPPGGLVRELFVVEPEKTA